MSLIDKAMTAFVEHGFDRSKMDVPAWALTCKCDLDEVRAAWERAMTVHSRKPSNIYGDGK